MAAFEGYDWIRRLPYTNALFVAKICTKLHGRIVKTNAICPAKFSRHYTSGIAFSISRKSHPEVLRRKRCSKKRQQIYRRITMSKCDFNKVTKQLY